VDGYLSIADAAILCKRPYISMYNAATSGALGPVHRAAGRYLLTVEGVEAYRRANQVEKQASSAKQTS
jgi:hypothetical protein